MTDINDTKIEADAQEKITIEGPGPLNPLPGKIDWTKPVQTTSGSPVRIIAIDLSLCNPVIGVIEKNDFDENCSTWRYNGRFLQAGPSTLDLQNVPEAQA